MNAARSDGALKIGAHPVGAVFFSCGAWRLKMHMVHNSHRGEDQVVVVVVVVVVVAAAAAAAAVVVVVVVVAVVVVVVVVVVVLLSFFKSRLSVLHTLTFASRPSCCQW